MAFTASTILFLDIETVPQYPSYTELPDDWKALWDLKSNSLSRYHEGATSESLYARAGIYAEFGKIVCISCGVLQGSGDQRKLVIKSFYGVQEQLLLQQFADMLTKWSAGEPKQLCAHNGKEFDFPYLCRRMIINEIKIPAMLNVSGKKPWEVPHLDTFELWKFGDFKSYTSLNLLAHSLGIPTPKDDIDGSQVGQVFWEQNDLERIMVYCQKDVVTVAQVMLRLQGEPLLTPEQVEYK